MCKILHFQANFSFGAWTLNAINYYSFSNGTGQYAAARVWGYTDNQTLVNNQTVFLAISTPFNLSSMTSFSVITKGPIVIGDIRLCFANILENVDSTAFWNFVGVAQPSITKI